MLMTHTKIDVQVPTPTQFLKGIVQTRLSLFSTEGHFETHLRNRV